MKNSLAKVVCDNLNRKLIKKIYMPLVYGQKVRSSAADIKIKKALELIITHKESYKIAGAFFSRRLKLEFSFSQLQFHFFSQKQKPFFCGLSSLGCISLYKGHACPAYYLIGNFGIRFQASDLSKPLLRGQS